MIDPISLLNAGAAQGPAAAAEPQKPMARQTLANGVRFGDVLHKIPQRPGMADDAGLAKTSTEPPVEGEETVQDPLVPASAEEPEGASIDANLLAPPGPDDTAVTRGAEPARPGPRETPEVKSETEAAPPAPGEPLAGRWNSGSAPVVPPSRGDQALPSVPQAQTPVQSLATSAPDTTIRQGVSQASASDAPARSPTPPTGPMPAAPALAPGGQQRAPESAPPQAFPAQIAAAVPEQAPVQLAEPASPRRLPEPPVANAVRAPSAAAHSARDTGTPRPTPQAVNPINAPGAPQPGETADLAAPTADDAQRTGLERSGTPMLAERSGRMPPAFSLADRPATPAPVHLPAATASVDPVADLAPPSLVSETGRLRAADMPLAPGPAPTATPALDRSMIVHIVQTSPQPGRPSIEITLSPEELGRVRLSLTNADGVLTVNLTTERPETMELLRRHASELAQEYRALGYEGVDFQFQQRSHQSDAFGPQDGPDRSGLPPMTEQAPVETQILTLSMTGVDIRI